MDTDAAVDNGRSADCTAVAFTRELSVMRDVRWHLWLCRPRAKAAPTVIPSSCHSPEAPAIPSRARSLRPPCRYSCRQVAERTWHSACGVPQGPAVEQGDAPDSTTPYIQYTLSHRAARRQLAWPRGDCSRAGRSCAKAQHSRVPRARRASFCAPDLRPRSCASPEKECVVE